MTDSIVEPVGEIRGVKGRKARDPKPLAGAVVIWLYADIASQVLSLLIAGATLGGLPVGEDQAWYPLAVVVLLIRLISTLGAAFVILKWIYRVNLNAHTIARGMTITPGWAIGWFFVPIATLWKPFQGLNEAWKVSAGQGAWRGQPTPSILRWWWGLWLTNSILGNISFRLNGALEAVVDIPCGLIAIALDVVFLQVVRTLSDMQVDALQSRTFD